MKARKSDNLPIDAMTLRLLQRYDLTDRSLRRQGRLWYPAAKQVCKGIARATQHELPTVCAIVAALSPQTNWDDNLTDACDYLAGRPMRPWQSRNRQKMSKCAAVMSHGPSALSGPKETPFYRNLMGDTDAVTVDTHAARAALGVRDIEPFMTVGAHDRIGDAYRKSAAEVGTDARAMQAIIWLQIRGE